MRRRLLALAAVGCALYTVCMLRGEYYETLRGRVWGMVSVWLVACAGCASKHSAAPVPPLAAPLAIYGRLPSIEDMALSPDGSRLAVVKTSTDNARVVGIVALADGSVLGGVKVGDAKLRDVRWVDDDRLLLITSVTAVPLGVTGRPREWGMLQIYDVATHQIQPLLGRKKGTMNVTFGVPMVRELEGRTLLFVGGYYSDDRSNWLKPGLFRVDAANGDEKLIRKGDLNTQGWLVDERGDVVAEHEYREDDQCAVFSIRRDGALREVATADDPFDRASLVGFDPAADAVVVQMSEDNQSVWKPLSLEHGTLAAATQQDIAAAVVNRRDGRVIGWLREGGEPHYEFVDPLLQARWNQVAQSFQGERVRLVSASDDLSKMVVLVEGQRDGYSYQIVDTTAHTVEPGGAVYNGLSEVFDVQRVTYPAADGLAITAYLTLPNVRPAKNLPLVVMPHGGPAAHDTLGFDWWAQALAASGYAVLQPNYRGSTQSVQLFTAGFGQWGRKMQTDLSDGVRFLVSQGSIDPTRVCIVGASYGGYAALAGVTLEAGVYRCAISVAGPSDLSRMVRPVASGDGPTERWWRRYMGVESGNDPILDTISPSRHAANATVPVLLIHGRDDTVVPYEHSVIMADALQRAGKPVELVSLKAEDHWLSRGATRLQMLEYVVGFLRVHNPPGATPVASVVPPQARGDAAGYRAGAAGVEAGVAVAAGVGVSGGAAPGRR